MYEQGGERPRRWDPSGTQVTILALVGLTVIVGLMVAVAAMPWIVAG